MIVYRLFVFDRNYKNHITVCEYMIVIKKEPVS